MSLLILKNCSTYTKRMGRYKMSGSPARPSFGVAPTSTISFTVGWMQTLAYLRKEKNVKNQ